MHEIGICQGIFNTLEAELTEGQLGKLREIHLKVGILSGVEPQFLQHAFQFMAAEGPFEQASLKIQLVDVRAACSNCADTFVVEKYRFVCPHCGQPCSEVLEGKELEIHKLILEEPEVSPYEKIDQ